MRKIKLAIIAIVVFGITSLQAQPGEIESSDTEKPFRGLSGVSVLVEDLGPEAAKAGVSEEELEAFVELKLRQNRVAVREINQFTLESPYIYINVNLVYLDNIDHFTYSISVSLNQTVRLLRNDTTLEANTWNKSTVGIVPRGRARAIIKDSVDSLLTFFIKKYLAANAKARN